jgi:hypothetical protein
MIVYRNGEGDLRTDKSDSDRIYQAIEKAVTTLRRQGLRVAYVLAPPSASYDVGRCIARLHHGMPLWGSMDGCAIDAAEFTARRGERLDALISRLRNQLDLSVIDFERTLCDAGLCTTMIDGIPLYRDAVHFTIDGGRHLIQKMALLDEIDRTAR